MKEKIKKIKISKSQIITIILAVAFSMVMSLGTSYAADIIFDSKNVGFDNTGTKIQATTVQGAIDELYDAATDYSSMNTRLTNVENQIYPVGSIYIAVNNTNPSTLFGGTWESFGEGRTLIGVGTGTDSNSTQKVFASNETGGEYNHTLTINEMPNHNHNFSYAMSANNNSSYYVLSGVKQFLTSAQTAMSTTYETGGSESHNNIQPYITVYMWKRTA